jgi:hypothetical protein
MVSTIACVLTVLALAGCGGGGGGGSDSGGSAGTAGGSSGSGAVTGLDFQGSAATAGTVRFQFSSPLAIYPATYIWRLYPRQQSGYYTTFFWGNGDFATGFFWSRGSPDTYYGAHPYPEAPPGGSTHRWEISVGGGDYVSAEQVVYDTWYTQVFRAWSDAAGKHHELYWSWPDTSKVVRRTEPATYANANPPSPTLVFGDAPWNPSNEILNGILRGIQVYSSQLSIADIQAEINGPLSSSAGAASIWYLNLNPTPFDISDQSGRGNSPAWEGSGRPLQWSGS